MSASAMITPRKHKFEIRVAVLGHVSVGKTTVINALFREKYGEVAMRRTTAGVNLFSISQQTDTSKDEHPEPGSESSERSSPTTDWSVVADDRTAESILKEITEDNAAFRESDEIHEKSFGIDVAEAFCKMRDDTKLVLVDIPGINEAGTGAKYKGYVEQNWSTFDCVMLVMDGRIGVNTEEQVELLKFVKKMQTQKKEVPVIVLCNKVDDPEEEEQALMVQEVRKEVEQIFEVGDRQASLSRMLDASKNGIRADADTFPIFITTSAIHAFIYRTASLMTLEEFKKFDKKLIEKLGHEEVGKWQWKKLSEHERYSVAHHAVSDQELYYERLEETNFHKVLAALKYCIGDDRNQHQLIKMQLSVSMKSLAPRKSLVTELSSVHNKSKLLGEPTEGLKAVFWKNYKMLERTKFDHFVFPNVDTLGVSMKVLEEYVEFAGSIGWADEVKMATQSMEMLVRRQLKILFDQERKFRNVHWTSRNDEEDLSPEDWKTICRSVLLLSCSKCFCSTFGQEKVWLESLVDRINRASYSCQRSQYHSDKEVGFEFEVMDMLLVPAKKQQPLFDKLFQIKVPTSFADPSHWGHLAWKYCEMAESLDVGAD